MEIYYWSQNRASLTRCAWLSQLLPNHDCDFFTIYRAALCKCVIYGWRRMNVCLCVCRWSGWRTRRSSTPPTTGTSTSPSTTTWSSNRPVCPTRQLHLRRQEHRGQTPQHDGHRHRLRSVSVCRLSVCVNHKNMSLFNVFSTWFSVQFDLRQSVCSPLIGKSRLQCFIKKMWVLFDINSLTQSWSFGVVCSALQGFLFINKLFIYLFIYFNLYLFLFYFVNVFGVVCSALPCGCKVFFI